MQFHYLGHYLGLSHHVEVLILSLLGIIFTVFDTSLFNLKSSLEQVRQLTLDEKLFSIESQIIMQYVLSSVVFVRTFSVHAYLAFYIVMLWPALFEDRPKLILPWLLVGAVRNLVATATAYSSGMFVCAAYKFSPPICADFVLSEIVEYGPSVYTWFCVLSYYRQLSYLNKAMDELKREQSRYDNETLERRRKSRSMYWDNSPWNTLLKLEEDDRQLISASTIENVLNHLSVGTKVSESRSLDSLLQSIANEAEKREIMTVNEDLKEEFEKDDQLSVPQKIVKLLDLTPSDITRARQAKNKRKTRVASDITPQCIADRTKAKRSSSDEGYSSHRQKISGIIPGSSEKELRTINIGTIDDIFKHPKKEDNENTKVEESTSKKSIGARDTKNSGIPRLRKKMSLIAKPSQDCPDYLRSSSVSLPIRSSNLSTKTSEITPSIADEHSISTSTKSPDMSSISEEKLIQDPLKTGKNLPEESSDVSQKSSILKQPIEQPIGDRESSQVSPPTISSTTANFLSTSSVLASRTSVQTKMEAKPSVALRIEAKSSVIPKADSKSSAISKVEVKSSSVSKEETKSVSKIESRSSSLSKMVGKSSIPSKTESRSLNASKTEAKLTSSSKVETKSSNSSKLDTKTSIASKLDPKFSKLDTKLSTISKIDPRISTVSKLDPKLSTLSKLDSKLSTLSKLNPKLSTLSKLDSKLSTSSKMETKSSNASRISSQNPRRPSTVPEVVKKVSIQQNVSTSQSFSVTVNLDPPKQDVEVETTNKPPFMFVQDWNNLGSPSSFNSRSRQSAFQEDGFTMAYLAHQKRTRKIKDSKERARTSPSIRSK